MATLSPDPSDGRPGGEKVHVDHPFEMREWSHRWNVTIETLEHAIRVVGPRVDDLRRYLGK
jgi:hypothetical protein